MVSSKDTIAKTLRRLQVRNYEGRDFTPHHCLVECLDRDTVFGLLKEEQIVDFYDREELANAILDNGLRLFAILVHIGKLPFLKKFLECDNFSAAHYDEKLPYSKPDLERIFEKDNAGAVKDFLATQWTHLPPALAKDRSCRTLDAQAVLPFEKVEKPSEGNCSTGGFGFIKIAHLYGPEKTPKSTRRKDDFSREVEILSMLRCPQYPHITELHTAFVQGEALSLLMPVADCDLGRVLNGKALSVRGLTTRDEICAALWGLASGLRAVHGYFAEAFDERRIGCHYDIKPPNILCMDGKLLLSDFGLSRLRKEEEGSESAFQHVGGAYMAPECLGAD
ncbi:hypothetical protein OQA88_867 [Cercophora sp. LCS_1]